MSQSNYHKIIVHTCTNIATATLCATFLLSVNNRNVRASTMLDPAFNNNVVKNTDITKHIVPAKATLAEQKISTRFQPDDWRNVDYTYDKSTGTFTIKGGTVENPMTTSMLLLLMFDENKENVKQINITGKLIINGEASSLFGNLPNLNKINGLENIDTSNVNNMSWMFSGDNNITNLDISTWNTSKVTDMQAMFQECFALTKLDLSKWDTSNVTLMAHMFYGCHTLNNLDVSKWITSNVTDMNSMFQDCLKLDSLDVSKWDTSKVTNMSYMFSGSNTLNELDVENWKTGSTTNMLAMFNECSNLTKLNVTNWDTSNVTDMSGMFQNCSKLTKLDIGDWKTDNASNMAIMFQKCSKLTELDVSNWNTDKVTDMSYMFNMCSSLNNLDVGKWNTSNVTNMLAMFNECNNLTKLDLGNFDDHQVSKSVDGHDGHFDMLSGLNNLKQLTVGKNISLGNATLDAPDSWISVGNGTVSQPAGSEYYSSAELSRFWNNKDYSETWLRDSKYQIIINYIDLDNDNKVIKTDNISGGTLYPVNYKADFDKIVTDLKKQHYDYIASSDKLPWSNGKLQLPTDLNSNTTYTVGFKHGTSTVKEGDKNPITGESINGLTKNILQTIKYTGAPETIADNIQKLTFTRNATVDMITGKVTYLAWNEKEQSFKDVTSPIVTGYDANINTVKGKTVTPDSNNITKTVTYIRSNYGIKINYLDGDDNNKILKADSIEGNPEKAILYKDRMNNIISSLTGYVLNRTKTDLPLDENGDIKLPADVLGNKTYNVILSHKVNDIKPGDKNPVTGEEITDLTKTITQTIKYNGVPQSISDNVQKLFFTRNATVDMVTGKLTYLDWNQNSQTFKDVTSPIIDGYAADNKVVFGATVKPTDSDITRTVTYTKKEVPAYEININYTDTNGKVVKTDTIKGKPGAIIQYHDQLRDIIKQLGNYEVDNDKSNLPLDDNNDIKLPEDLADNHDYKIILKHKMATVKSGDKNPVTGKEINDLSKNITQTIEYKGTPVTISNNVQKVTFERTADVDLVTGKLTYHDWDKDDQSFKEVTSPVIDGYDADIKVVSGATVKPDDSDINKTVTYTKKEAPAYNITINYTDGAGQIVKTDTIKGKPGTTVQYHNQLTDIIKQLGNYEIDKDKSNLPLDKNNDIKLPEDLTDDHDYHLVLKHKIVTIKPGDKNPVTNSSVSDLIKEIKQTIKYSGTNKTIPDNIQTVKFTRNATVDMVTGKITYLEWDEKEKTFEDVTSPTIKGYVPDTIIVKGTKVVATDKDIVKQITYKQSSNNQNDNINPDYQITIDYQDPNGKVVKTDIIKGKANQTIPYKDKMEQIINSIAKNGYEVDWAKSNLPVDKNGNIKLGALTEDTNYKVVLKHKMVTFKHGEKNPFTGKEDPNLEHRVVQTIKYQGLPNQDIPDNVQTLTFTRNAKIDMITGKVTYLEWNEKEQSFKEVDSPNVKGYTANMPMIKSETVNGNSSDITKIVTYHKNNIIQTGLNFTKSGQASILGTLVIALTSLLSYLGFIKIKDKNNK